MRVSTNMKYSHTYFNLMRSEEIINQKNKQISSGRRIEMPSDDPFGTSRAMTYRTCLTEVAQYTTNSNIANSWLEITDNSLQSVSSFLQRVQELVIAGANSSNTPESWGAMADEIDKIRDAIVELANTTIGERYIFGGEKVLERPYEYRNPVSGGPIDLTVNPITIIETPNPGANDQFSIVIDGNPPLTITLPPGTYDNSPGRTINDLVNDIQTQINMSIPTTVPVHVKATLDNRLVFYAGTQPPGSTVHTLVMREVNGALAALGFQDQATTKEITSNPLTFPISIMAKYPVANTGTVAGATITLDPNDAKPAGYYDNWTLMVDDGTTVQTQIVQPGSGATVTPVAAWNPPLVGPDVKYFLSPPLTGQAAAGATATTIPLTNASTVDDFYVGMPITISDGTGKNQTRTITAYDAGTGVATIDPPFATIPDDTSRYAIDANYYVNDNNKFRITVGNQLTQEISLDGGNYTPAEFAQMVQTKIRERGGQYANVNVTITADNRLKIIPVDAADNPLTIRLESGSNADALWLLGFKNGAVSNELLPNYEGNRGTMNYEINVGIKLSVNSIGDQIFDPILEHLTKISIDLRSGNVDELSGNDIRDVKQDLQRVAISLSEIGAKGNRINKGLERLQVFDENYNRLLSQTEDTDIAKAILELKLQETAYQAALQSAARILPMTLLDYLR